MDESASLHAPTVTIKISIVSYVRHLVLSMVDFSLPPAQLSSFPSDINLGIIRPLVSAIRDLNATASVYALLYVCREFTDRSATDLGARDLWRTRAHVCSAAATRLLKWLPDADLVHALFLEFAPQEVTVDVPPRTLHPTSTSSTTPPVSPATAPLSSTSTSTASRPAPVRSTFHTLGATSTSASLSYFDLATSRNTYARPDSHVSLISASDRASPHDPSIYIGAPMHSHSLDPDPDADADPVDDAVRDTYPESALSLAVDCHATRFTAHPLVQRVVRWIWDGRVVVVRGVGCVGANGNGSGHRGVDLSTTGNTPGSVITVRWVPARTRAEEVLSWKGFVDVDKLRVPKYQYLATLTASLAFLVLYTVLSLSRPRELTPLEVACDLLAASLLMDEVSAFVVGGWAFYLENLWNWLDVGIFVTYAFFFVMRSMALQTDDDVLNEKAFDTLAVVNVFLWPRFLAMFDRFQFFGTLTIIIKRLLADSYLYVVLLAVIALGFQQALYALALGKDAALTYWELGWQLSKVLCSITWDILEFSTTIDNHMAPGLALAFVAVVSIVLVNLLISIFNLSFSEITANASSEFEFQLAYLAVEAQDMNEPYPFVPPANLLEPLLVWPLKFILPADKYARYNLALLRVVGIPIFACVWVGEVLALAGDAWAGKRRGGYTALPNEDANAKRRRRRTTSFKHGSEQLFDQQDMRSAANASGGSRRASVASPWSLGGIPEGSGSHRVGQVREGAQERETTITFLDTRQDSNESGTAGDSCGVKDTRTLSGDREALAALLDAVRSSEQRVLQALQRTDQRVAALERRVVEMTQ